MSDIIKCPICENEFDRDYDDICSTCGWLYIGIEKKLDETKIVEANGISIKQARENFKNGKDIWGDPIKK